MVTTGHEMVREKILQGQGISLQVRENIEKSLEEVRKK